MAKKCMKCGGSMKYKTGGDPTKAEKAAKAAKENLNESYKNTFIGKSKKLDSIYPSMTIDVKTGKAMPKKAKGGSFPDLTGDGKVTKADILKGRGVFKKGGASKAHPGFKAVQASIAKKQGVSKKAAGAILAASTRKASAAAKRANPRLKRVKG